MKRNKLTGTGSIGLFETGDLVSPFAMELFLFTTSEASTRPHLHLVCGWFQLPLLWMLPA